MASGSALKKIVVLSLTAIFLVIIVFLPIASRDQVRVPPEQGQGNTEKWAATQLAPPTSEGVSRWVELQTHLDKMATLSQDPDIDQRGQWQKRQIDHYCKRYGLEHLENSLPANTGRENHFHRKLYRHLIFDDKQKIIFCFIPKVGCTNMRRFIFLNQGLIPEKVLSINMTDFKERAKLEGYYLQPSIMKTSFDKKNLTDTERLEKLRNYYKFTFVRNPLERLLSAYLDKIAPPLRYQPKRKNNPDVYQHLILSRYRPTEFKKWDGSYELQVTFSEYVRFLIEADKLVIDEHYAPLTANAQPCRIRYDFYGSFKLYDSEMDLLIKKLDANPKYFTDAGDHKGGKKTEDLMEQYFSQLSEDLKQRLFRSFYQDFDFYYHLYPEDSLSHVHILGVEEEVPVYCPDCPA